ncbi:MAG: hypothetical protein WDZ91_05640 [Paenibacillaceae bacterium]
MSKKYQARGSSFIRGEHGSVTIYTILIIVPIFIFQAVLIDFVRIKVASMEAEQAIRAATRSVLSAYDKRLLDYGLFGLKANAEERKTIANRVLSKYGTDGTQSDTFRWLVLNTLVDQTSVVPMYTLGDHRLINQQILDDMKYKAPIEFTRNLYDKWKGKKEMVDKTEEEVNQAEGIDALLQQRENRLESAFDHIKQMINLVEDVYVSYNSKLSDDYTDGEVDVDSENLLNTARNDFLDLQQQYQTMSGYVQDAEQIEQSMLQQWDQEKKGKLNDAYILGHEFYLNYTIGATTPISTFGAFINQLAADQEDGFHPADTQPFYDSFQSWFALRSNEENRRVAAYENLEQKKKEQKKIIKNQMDQTKQAVNAQVCSNVNAEQYDHLKTYYHNYLNLNNSMNQQEYDPGASLDQSSDQYQTNSISYLSHLTNMMESIRDEAYVNEYAMYYFNYRTTSMQRFASPLQDKLNEHALQGQEVEYILYGLSSCTANRMAAYTEIYMLRFAIRMLESLMDVRKATVGSPLLTVLIAAAEGGIRAYGDMIRITNGEEVPVFAKWGTLTMNYADYLRMFLSVHSKDDRKLSRIQALIQLNTQIDLLQRPAYIELKSIMTIRLWFIRGKQYQIKKTAAMSY